MAQALEVIERNGRWIRWVAGGYHFTTPELPNESWVELGAVYGVSFFYCCFVCFLCFSLACCGRSFNIQQRVKARPTVEVQIG
jgi:hypothetical protein